MSKSRNYLKICMGLVYFKSHEVAVVFLLRDGKLNVVVIRKKGKNCSVHTRYRPVYEINSLKKTFAQHIVGAQDL
jgi:hypothetical protein